MTARATRTLAAAASGVVLVTTLSWHDCRRGEKGTRLRFKSPPPTDIYLHPFTVVIGLYSRHGHFHPPYDLIPDVNHGELLQNFW